MENQQNQSVAPVTLATLPIDHINARYHFVYHAPSQQVRYDIGST